MDGVNSEKMAAGAFVTDIHLNGGSAAPTEHADDAFRTAAEEASFIIILLILIASLTGLPVSDRTPAPVSWVCQVFPSRETA